MFWFNAFNTYYLPLHTRKKERNALFNDALNTFYLQLYGVRYGIIIVKRLQSEKIDN